MHLALENIRQAVFAACKNIFEKNLKSRLLTFYYLPASIFAKMKLNALEKPTAS
jgi:hypothetical protein